MLKHVKSLGTVQNWIVEFSIISVVRILCVVHKGSWMMHWSHGPEVNLV